MNIYNHNDAELDLLRIRHEINQSDIAKTQNIISQISSIFLKKILHSNDRVYSPIIILRGGLLMYGATLNVFKTPISFIYPKKEYCGKTVEARADLAILDSRSNYLFIDTIMNTGKTANSCIKFLKENTEVNDSNISFASIFGTDKGLKNIISTNNIEIHSLWYNYETNSTGLLKGINYDAGNYASNQRRNNERVIF